MRGRCAGASARSRCRLWTAHCPPAGVSAQGGACHVRCPIQGHQPHIVRLPVSVSGTRYEVKPCIPGQLAGRRQYHEWRAWQQQHGPGSAPLEQVLHCFSICHTLLSAMLQATSCELSSTVTKAVSSLPHLLHICGVNAAAAAPQAEAAGARVAVSSVYPQRWQRHATSCLLRGCLVTQSVGCAGIAAVVEATAAEGFAAVFWKVCCHAVSTSAANGSRI